jgi:hypothetical protein
MHPRCRVAATRRPGSPSSGRLEILSACPHFLAAIAAPAAESPRRGASFDLCLVGLSYFQHGVTRLPALNIVFPQIFYWPLFGSVVFVAPRLALRHLAPRGRVQTQIARGQTARTSLPPSGSPRARGAPRCPTLQGSGEPQGYGKNPKWLPRRRAQLPAHYLGPRASGQ